jgi:hypothetical protein
VVPLDTSTIAQPDSQPQDHRVIFSYQSYLELRQSVEELQNQIIGRGRSFSKPSKEIGVSKQKHIHIVEERDSVE